MFRYLKQCISFEWLLYFDLLLCSYGCNEAEEHQAGREGAQRSTGQGRQQRQWSRGAQGVHEDTRG